MELETLNPTSEPLSRAGSQAEAVQCLDTLVLHWYYIGTPELKKLPV